MKKFRTRWSQTRYNYWSCTKVADWIRGTPKPYAETGEGWAKWRRGAKAKRFRYWAAEELLDSIQNTLYLPLDILSSIRYYVSNRWVTKTHALTAHPDHIPRGQWRDIGSRFLPCLFNELRDYVEVELAWKHVSWSNEARQKYGAPQRLAAWRSRSWRCPQAGLDHLQWESELVHDDEWVEEDSPLRGQPTQQALNAREVMELYNWWVNVYPHRVDSHDLSGWTEHCRLRREVRKSMWGDDEDTWSLAEDRTPQEQEESRRILDLCTDIEQRYENEETEMMIRLIKIRKGLWT